MNLFTSKKLCITARAPERPSKLTFHVKASPLAFSESNSFTFFGNALRQSNIIRGNRPIFQKYQDITTTLRTRILLHSFILHIEN